MEKKETIRSLWTPTAGMLIGARRVAMLLITTLLLTMTAQTARANYDWYDTSITIGGITADFSQWSLGNGAPDTDLDFLNSLTISSVKLKLRDDSNDRDGINMFFRLYGDNGQIGGDVDVWLGGAERIEGSVHDFSVSYTGPFDLADAFGVTLEHGKTYYLNMWAKSYGPEGDHWYNGDGDNYHTKFTYISDEWDLSTKTLTVKSNPADETYKNRSIIENLIISDGVTSIGDYAFANCTGLTSVTVYAPDCTLGDDAFDGCSNLTNIYVFSDKVNSYKSADNWSTYADIITAMPNPQGTCGDNVIWELALTSTSGILTISGTGAMADYDDPDDQPWKDYRSSITKVVIGNGVTSIGNNAFTGVVAKFAAIVTQDNFYSYFDENCILLDAVTSDELIFQGEFSELVSRITLDRSITITGDNAVLKNIAFNIAGDGVKLENMTLDANSNLGNLIDITGENAVISNLNITYDGGVEEAVAINVAGDNVNILNNTISFESYVPDDSEFAIALKLTDCYNALVDGNSITTQLPCVYVNTYDEDYYIMGSDRVNPVRLKDCEGLVFKNNTINSTTNDYSADFPTIQAIQIIGCHNSVLDHNNISMIDEMTPAGMDIYLYGINFGYNDNVTFSNNNFNISTKGGKDAAGTAYAFQGVESEVKIIGNSITSISNGPNIGIYVTSMYDGDSDIIIKDNFIKVTGCASSLGSWALVSGIEIQNGDAKIYNNTVYTYNVNAYDEDAYMYGISYAQWMYGDRSFDIQNNTVYTEGKYAISVIDAKDLNVEKNTLFAHELKGDDSVNPGSCADVNIEDNLSEGDLSWSVADGTLSITGKGAMTAAATNAYPWYNDCSVITTINIGEGVTSIADNAFGSVSNINTYSNVTKVFIPSTVTSIGADAFKGCVSATDVYCYADPAKLTWGDLGDDFKSDGSTICHVADANDWSRFSSVNVTFVDDLADVSIPYIDADGNTAYCTNFTVLTGSTQGVTLGSDGETTWYVVNSNVDYKQIKLVGNVNLILCDGQTMTAISGSASAIIGDNRYNNSLTIYGQTAGTGKLEAMCGTGCGISSNAITINGGTVYAHGSFSAIYADGNITINGGTVNAEGGDYFVISAGGNVIINGGKVSATGNSGGIMARGNIILGWTNNTDRIYASSFSAGGTISIADGKAFTDGANVYNSATPSSTLAALTDVTLIPKKDFTKCKATVPNQTRQYNRMFYQFEAANQGNYSVGETIEDGETTLTLGQDYEFGSIEYADPNKTPSYAQYEGDYDQLGDELVVTINGKGDYSGTLYATFKIIVPDAEGTWNNLKWAYHDGTLTISKKDGEEGNVAMPDGNNYDDFDWKGVASSVFTLTIGEGITNVGNYAFGSNNGVQYYGNLTTINLPSTLTTIGNYAFAYCGGLTIDLSDIPTSVTTIGSNAFGYVDGLTATLTDIESGNALSRLSSVFAGYDVEVSFSRTFKENVASTLCLPYDFEPKGGTFYEFTSVNDAWTEVTMTSVNPTSTTPLTAGKPYLFMPAADGPLDFTGIITNVANSYTAGTKIVGDWTFTGTYEEKRWDASNNPDGRIFGFATNQGYEGQGPSQNTKAGDFIRLNSGGIKPFRAYLEYTGTLQARTRGEGGLPETMTVRLVGANGEIQGIGEIRLSTGEVTFDSRAWYDLNGRRLDGQPSEKGIYINGGRKVVIK